MKNTNPFIRIYTAEGNTILNINNVVSVETDSFKSGGETKTYEMIVETTDGKKRVFRYSTEQYGEDAMDMRDNAIEALTGLSEDD